MKFFPTIRKWAIGIKQDVFTLWFAYKHPATPWHVKLLCLFVVAYIFSPIDLIPDFIPILGYVDDVLLVPFLIRVSIRLLPKEILFDSRQKASEWRAKQRAKPRNYVAAIIILLVWGMLIYWCARWIISLMNN